MSLETEEHILNLTMIVEYTDGTRELKTSLQDPEEVIQLLEEVAEEVDMYGLDTQSFTFH